VPDAVRRATVVVADDHEMVRRGLAATLAAVEPSSIELVGMAADGQEALGLVTAESPDVLITDLRMPRMDGLELMRRVGELETEVAVLMLTVVEDPAAIREALDHGASGYLLKTASAEEIVEAVWKAVDGELVVSSRVGSIIARQLVDRGEQQLSDREVEVIGLVAAGNTNAQIASQLFVSETTVRTHLRRSFTKLGVRDRASAVAEAIRLGLVDVS